MTRRYMLFGLALLSLGLTGVGRPAAADENVTVTVGKIRTARFRQQVARVQVFSDNKAVVKVRYREGFGVQLLGVSPGTATVTVSGELVRYNTGIPRHRPRSEAEEGRALGDLRSVPLTNNRAFTNTYQVTVVESPE